MTTRILRKTAFSTLLLFTATLALAQYKVTFVVLSLPAYHKASDPVYLAGSFNNWNPGEERYRLKSSGNSLSLTLSLPKGLNEYKLTRGNWEKGESGNEGAPVANRLLQVDSDTTLYLAVVHWADHFPPKPKRSTANRHVRVIDTAFFIPQLGRHRRVWIYLPESYSSSKKKYPVLYMHDGQNVFDDSTSGYGEWGVDEAMDTLGTKYREAIVVAVDHGGEKRLNEYAPYDMQRFGKGEGGQYIDFLVKNLKPFIDKHYRTRKCRKHTFIAGSSMGGLISFYAMVKYPKVFGGAGVFSPAFWVNPQLKDIVPKTAKKVKGKIYFYGGMLEGETMIPDMLAVFQRMLKVSKAKMETVVRAEGRHNEATWRKEFPHFYQWLMR